MSYKFKKRYSKGKGKRTFRKSFGFKPKALTAKRWPITRYGMTSTSSSSGPMKTLDVKFSGTYTIPYAVDSNTPKNLNIDSTGAYQNLTCIRQGTGVGQRIGNKVKLLGLKYRFEIDANPATFYGYPSYLRLMFIYDRQPGYNTTSTSYYWPVNQLLQDSRQDNTQVVGVYDSNISTSQMERLVVLSDRLVSLPPIENNVAPDALGPTAMATFVYEGYIKLRGMETVFNTSSSPALIGDISTGALYVLAFGDVTDVDAPWSLTGTTRLRFQDC
nr:MAG: capsid protein [Cressdnaviricota sp.]